MTEMVFGQLYRVGFTGFSENNMETTKTDYLIVGNGVEDVKNRLPYLIDVSEFDRYRIDYCAKEPSRAFVLSTKLEKTTENKPDVVVAREFGSDAFWQAVSATKPGKVPPRNMKSLLEPWHLHFQKKRHGRNYLIGWRRCRNTLKSYVKRFLLAMDMQNQKT